MLKIADFRAFYRVFRRSLFASVLVLFSSFSIALADCAPGYTMNSDNECVQQTCPEGESLNVLYDLNLFNPEGTLSGFGFDTNGVFFGDGHHDYLNDRPNTFGVWNVDHDEILLGSAMCSKDDEALSPASSLNVDSQNPEDNKYCWCSLTGGVQKDAQYSLSPSTWVYLTGDLGSECEKYCAKYCAGLGYSGNYLDFIRQLLNQEYCTPRPYKVSYYCEKQKWLDGKEPLSVDTVFYGSSGYSFYGDENMTLAEPCAPAGYHVDGFECFTATNEDSVDDSVANPWTINDDVVCFASYAPNDYTITLNKVNGSGGANNVYTRYNTNVYRDSGRTQIMTTSANPITTPSRTGYNFMGYYISSSGNNQNPYIDENGYITQAGVNTGKALTSDGTWWAHWTPKTYTISYGSGNHGSVPNNGADPVAYANGLTYGSTWTTKTFAETGIVADTGYVFSGWNTSADGSGTSYTANTQQSAWTTDSGLTLYAVYGCDTGYTMNSNNECVQQTCPEGESLNILEDLKLFNPEGTLSGFGFDMNGVLFGEGHPDYLNGTPNTFGVWNVDQDGILLGSAMCSKDDEALSPASSLNVDSQNPEENKYCWCSLTGGVQKDAQYSLSPSTWVYLTGDLGSECEKYCAEYCAGLGYSGDYRDFIRQLLNQEYCTPQQYKVSYYCEEQNWLDGEEPLSVDTVFYGSSGYSFDGGENMTLAETSCGIPEGHHIVGFECFTATNEDPVDDSVANPWTINDNVVCFASYAPNDYTITLNKVNGSGGANNVYTRYNTNVYRDSGRTQIMTTSANPIATPSKTGYSFMGYYASSSGNNQNPYINANGFITSAGLIAGKSVTYNNGAWYAHWTPKTYTISYGSGNHGSVPNNGADPVAYANGLTYGSTWTTKTFAETGIDADTGYVFSHWNTSADDSGATYQANALQSEWTTDSGLTLYAVYNCAPGYSWNNDNTACVQQSTSFHDVTYDCSLGSGTPVDSNNPYAVGATVTTLAANVCTYDNPGYILVGWNCSSGVGNINAGATFTMPSLPNVCPGCSVHCSAQWECGAPGYVWDENSGTCERGYGVEYNACPSQYLDDEDTTGLLATTVTEASPFITPAYGSLGVLKAIKPGYHHSGWLYGDGTVAPEVIYLDDNNTPLELYAQCSANTNSMFYFCDESWESVKMGEQVRYGDYYTFLSGDSVYRCNNCQTTIGWNCNFYPAPEDPFDNGVPLAGALYNGFHAVNENVTWSDPRHVQYGEGGYYCFAVLQNNPYQITYSGGTATNPNNPNSATHTVTTVAMPPQNVHYADQNVTLNANTYAQEGYDFDGWSCTGTVCGQQTSTTFTFDDEENIGEYEYGTNLACTAQWTPKQYDVIYNPGVHGTGGTTITDGIEYDGTYTVLSATGASVSAVSNAYVFTGWNDGTADRSVGYIYNPYTVDGPLILTAQWDCAPGYSWNNDNTACVQQSTSAYYVTYSCGSHGSGTPVDLNNPYAAGATVTTLAANVCTADTGYTFGGWACDNNVGTVLAGTTFTMPSANVSCTAQWTPKKYNVIYNPGAHGISGSTITNGIEYDGTYTVLSATEAFVSAISNAYVFTGWNDGTADRSVGYIYNPYTVDGPLILTAQWDCAPGYSWNNVHTQCLKPYDVEYHACTSQYLDNNDTTGLLTNTLSRPNPQYIELYGSTGLKDIKTGYHFDTWLDANNTSYMNGWYQYDSNQNYYQINLDDNTSPLRLYAQCSANRTNVRYYCGENLVHSDYATYDQSYTFYNNATACGPCATVTSWNCSYIEKIGTIPIPNRPYSGSHNVGQTVTWNDPTNDYGTQHGYFCVAVTQNNSYQITYSGGTATNPNNPNSATHTVATVAMSPQNVNYGDQNVTLNANTYAQEGYDFDGWSCTGTVCGQQTSVTDTADDGQNIGTYKFGTNLACTAQWTPKKYNVIYNPGVHGTGGTTITDGIEYDGTYTVLSATGASVSAVSNAYVFTGWNDGTADRSVGYIYNPYTVDGPLTLTAQWDCAPGYSWNNDNTACVQGGFSVTYSCGSHGSGSPTDSNSPYVSGATVTTLAASVCTADTGYTFGGWVCDNNVGTVLAGTTFTMPSAPVTCTAQWGPVIGLRWNTNGGTPGTVSAPAACVIGSAVGQPGSISGIAQPTKTGYRFLGWDVMWNFANINVNLSGANRYARSAYSCWYNGNSASCSNTVYNDISAEMWKIEMSAGTVYGASQCQGFNCYCKATGFSPSGNNRIYQPSAELEWKYIGNMVMNGMNACAYMCAQSCSNVSEQNLETILGQETIFGQ